MKAIIEHGDVYRTLDVEALEDYLAYGFVPSPRAIFRRVIKLPAGHVLSVTAETLDASPRRYWRWQPQPADRMRSLEEWQEAIRAKIDETVKAHRIADVPVGAFLSGGLDSSLVVSHLAKQSSEAVQSFSI